jgi:5-methylcytosine-specific restriction endonuclease McrA
MADPHRPAFLQDDDEPAIKWWPWLIRLHRRGFFAVGIKNYGFIGIKRRPGKPLKVQMPSEFVAELRKRAYKRARKLCIYCHERVYLQNSPSRGRMATLEHRIPLSRGGTWKKTNLGCSCSRCNKMKSDMTEIEFRAIIAEHGFGDHRIRNAAKASQRERTREHQAKLAIKDPA